MENDMILTKEEAVTLHRKMWKWISEQTLERQRVVLKNEYFNEHKLKRPMCGCYCCKYSSQKSNDNSCRKCPIDWGVGYSYNMCEMSKYKLWQEQTDYKLSANVAKQIAELPERQ